MIEMTEHGVGPSISFAALDADVRRVAAGLARARCAQGAIASRCWYHRESTSPCACTPAGGWARSWCSSMPVSVPVASVER